MSSRPVLDVVIEELGLELDYEEMTRKLEIENPTDTRILTLTVTDGDPVMAKTIVDAITDRVSEYIGDIMEMEAPKIIEYGQVSMEPVSPNVMRNAAIGGVLGIVAVCGIVTLMVVMNDTVRTEDDVEKYLGPVDTGSDSCGGPEASGQAGAREEAERTVREERAREERVREVEGPNGDGRPQPVPEEAGVRGRRLWKWEVF